MTALCWPARPYIPPRWRWGRRHNSSGRQESLAFCPGLAIVLGPLVLLPQSGQVKVKLADLANQESSLKPGLVGLTRHIFRTEKVGEEGGGQGRLVARLTGQRGQEEQEEQVEEQESRRYQRFGGRRRRNLTSGHRYRGHFKLFMCNGKEI